MVSDERPPVVSPTMKKTPRPSEFAASLLHLLLCCGHDQVRDLECLSVAAELLRRTPRRILREIRVVVAGEKADEYLSENAAADWAHPLALVSLLRLGQDVVPERGVVRECG